MSSENLEGESRDEKRFKETLNSSLYTDTTSSDHPSHMLRSLHFAPYVYATHSQVEEHSLCTCISTKFPFLFLFLVCKRLGLAAVNLFYSQHSQLVHSVGLLRTFW
jgi:hypothetical protein